MAPRTKTRTKKKTTTTRGRGRPSKLGQIATTRPGPNGTTTEVTVAERIVELVRSGAYIERACAAVDIRKSTHYGWLRIAAHARSALAENPTAKLTAHQRECLTFSDAVDRAEAEWEMAQNLHLERLGQGIARERVVEKWAPVIDPATGRVVVDPQTGNPELRLDERKVYRETAEPNAQVIQWRLTRRFPDRYQIVPNGGAAEGEMPEAEVTEQTIDDLVADLDMYRAELADGSVDET